MGNTITKVKGQAQAKGPRLPNIGSYCPRFTAPFHDRSVWTTVREGVI